MDIVFLGIVVFLFMLAIFDLSVGVSNDAVNFLSSAIGSKAASFKCVIAVAAIGILIGAVMSNGMMDIARHGIFKPENLSFYDIMAIFMAVMVTDIILLDIFNSLGMPTSTTVSMVFELLGASFVVALFKLASPDNTLGIGEFLNTEKALSVILGIFLSVAIAFLFGTIVQFISRLIFTFEYKGKMKWKAGLFGGIACTAIIYFLLIKGFKDMSIMTPGFKMWIKENTLVIIGISLIGFTLLMQLLYFLKVNVFKIVVLLGTFSLAMAFAGNDLVNFIGVPLTSFDSYQDYVVNGAGNHHQFMMGSLNLPAKTPFYFLVGAGMIMVVSLATSKKARQVTQTTIGLSSQNQGEEIFGSSRIGRSLVRYVFNACKRVNELIPEKIRLWISQRMDTSVQQPENGAAFDLVRGAVNLMLAGMLIAWGTSMKLPLSTTFVTFMVAMGTSLADRAWGRESAVFRITGVISVIGGWFITAGVAFIGAGIVVCMMHMGGVPVMIAGGIIALVVLLRSNIRFKKKRDEGVGDSLFYTIINVEKSEDVWPLLRKYLNEKEKEFLLFGASAYRDIIIGFMNNKVKLLSVVEKQLNTEKGMLKSQRRKLTLCFRKASPYIVMEKRTWFHLSDNMSISMIYSFQRINEVCKEHVDNNFTPLPLQYHDPLETICNEVCALFAYAEKAVDADNPMVIDSLRKRCDLLKQTLTSKTRDVYDLLHNGNSSDMTVAYVYLNLLQESQELVTSLRKMLRAIGKINLEPSRYRSFSQRNLALQ